MYLIFWIFFLMLLDFITCHFLTINTSGCGEPAGNLRVRFLNLIVKASPKGQKVILTIRDSDEQWWESWCRFNEQEIRRDAIGSFNTRMILLRAAEIGYMGPQFRFIDYES